jgi:hypothetical protein
MNRVMCRYSVAGEWRIERSEWRATRRHHANELDLGSPKVAQLVGGGIINGARRTRGETVSRARRTLQVANAGGVRWLSKARRTLRLANAGEV